MKKNNTIMNIMQILITLKEVELVCNLLGYKDTSRKFTVYSTTVKVVTNRIKWAKFKISSQLKSSHQTH